MSTTSTSSTLTSSDGADVEPVHVKWRGDMFEVPGLVRSTSTIRDLKSALELLTRVRSTRQKLMGLKGVVMMMGTPDDQLLEHQDPDPDVVDDFEVTQEDLALRDLPENIAKIKLRVDTQRFEFRVDPDPNKKTLVLDIDYTLFDHRSVASNPLYLMRPYLHDFLAGAYEHYNIVLWSATSMKWIEVKMSALGVLDNPRYNVCLLVDSTSMITVHTPERGVVQVKPLAVLWGSFPQFFTPENTIMFDDVKRNFLLNAESGLRIDPYRDSANAIHTDTVLRDLGVYLNEIKDESDFRAIRHSRWRRRLEKTRAKRIRENDGEE